MNNVKLYDVTTGKEKASVAIDAWRPYPTALAFSPDGRYLAVNNDKGVQLFNLPQLVGGEMPNQRAEFPRLWDGLASGDSAMAYRSWCRLVAAGPDTVTFLHERMKPVAEVPPDQLARLIEQLGNRRYRIRQQAALELERLGEAAETQLKKALADTSSLDLQRNLETLLATLAEPRQERALDVLESIGSVAARRFLEKLAGGMHGARLTVDAKRAIGRLAEREGQR